MAFQHPICPPTTHTIPQSEEHQPAPRFDRPQQAQPTEWLLFPNAKQNQPSWSPPASTSYSPQTAGLSRLSEFGSLHTAALPNNDAIADDALEDDELDSLDDGLHAFREDIFHRQPPQVDQSTAILPTHDGFGTFPGSSHPVQEHLWHFERFNPHRRSSDHHRRRSSIQRKLDALEVDDGLRIEKERTERIQNWRMEHSRILLEEVEKATRRASSQPDVLSKVVPPGDTMKAWSGSMGESEEDSEERQRRGLRNDVGTVQHDKDLWRRIIRTVIGDLMGINDTTLTLISGEALPGDEDRPDNHTSIFSSARTDRRFALQTTSKWTLALLESLSKELASLLRRLAQSPAAIGSPVNPLNLDYAGIPIPKPFLQPSAVPLPHNVEQIVDAGSTPTPIFNPTLNQRQTTTDSEFGHAALWGIEEESTASLNAAQDREYWEQTPSIRTVFRLLHQHFTARRRPLLTSGTLCNSKPSNVATRSTAASVRRAAVIRQQHPLVSRQGARRSATGNMSVHTHRHHDSYANLSASAFRWSGSSCASTSARKSKRGSGSSRNYWDLRGSVGSGVFVGMGAWGEV
ncbi:MAG: hypothetical protein LQ337_004872 [Flavoplaca oasis]|nr:MAG: hypothetical protein LQ337_004872 [Flavoplaca oasis]